MVDKSFTIKGVFATAANVQSTPTYPDLKIVRTDTGKIQFHNPTIG
jgi:hypothetical protein